jgi:glutathione synthase/RimK-type ligase-like ATP-grasp enzyme
MANGPVLVVTSLEDVTADLVIAALNRRGVPVVRLDPARHGLSGLLNDLPVPQVNAPLANARAEYKPSQLRAAAELGFTVPPTLVTNDPAAARRFAGEHRSVIYKSFCGVPPADGETGAIWTQRVKTAEIDESVSVTAHLFQAEVKKTGDVRITVVGRRVFASHIQAPGSPLDWRSGDWDRLEYSPIDLPTRFTARLHAYLDRFCLAFGCFDFAVDDTEDLVFIECNPNGQWGFLPESDSIADAFAELLQNG